MLQLEDLINIATPSYKDHVRMVQFIEGLYEPPKRLTKGLDRWLFKDYLLVSSPIKERRIWWYMPRNLLLSGFLSGKPLVRYFFRKVDVMKGAL